MAAILDVKLLPKSSRDRKRPGKAIIRRDGDFVSFSKVNISILFLGLGVAAIIQLDTCLKWDENYPSNWVNGVRFIVLKQGWDEYGKHGPHLAIRPI